MISQTTKNTLNTFFGAGISSAIVGYLVNNVDPIFAAILWTLPFTLIFPIFNMHKSNKSNQFIGKFLKTQTYTMVLLIVFLYASAYFIENAPLKDGISGPLLKGAGTWLIVSIVYYIIVKNIKSIRNRLTGVKSENIHIH